MKPGPFCMLYKQRDIASAAHREVVAFPELCHMERDQE